MLQTLFLEGRNYMPAAEIAGGGATPRKAKNVVLFKWRPNLQPSKSTQGLQIIKQLTFKHTEGIILLCLLKM